MAFRGWTFEKLVKVTKEMTKGKATYAGFSAMIDVKRLVQVKPEMCDMLYSAMTSVFIHQPTNAYSTSI